MMRSLAVALAMSGLASGPVGAQIPAPQQPANPDAKAISDFLTRVNEYVAVHQKVERAAPKLPDEATPQQVDQTQRALASGIQSARVGAKRGDIFIPEMTAFVKRLLNRVFAGPEGWQLRRSIMDENVTFIPLTVNQRYPDAIPLTSMPPEVLNVSVVFTGHDHFYERIKPQKGIAHFVVGSAGKLAVGDLDDRSPITAKGFDTDYAFLVAEIIDDDMHFNTISRAGEIVDSGIVLRRRPPPS